MDYNHDFERWLPPRRVPAALVMTLLMQAAGGLIWATHLEARVSRVEQLSVNAVVLNEQFARLDERLEYLKQQIDAMHRQMEQISKRLMQPH